jgi:hypothetical protein
MPTLRPYNDHSEHEVINLFTVTGDLPRGTFVTAADQGVNLSDANTIGQLSPFGNTVSAVFNVPWNAVAAPSGTAKASVIGATLKDFRTYDENGEKLLFHPRKAAEMDVIISGQAVPVLTRGIVLYSGIVGTPGYGSGAAVSDAGDGSIKVVAYNPATSIGKFLGPKNAAGHALLKIEL